MASPRRIIGALRARNTKFERTPKPKKPKKIKGGSAADLGRLPTAGLRGGRQGILGSPLE